VIGPTISRCRVTETFDDGATCIVYRVISRRSWEKAAAACLLWAVTAIASPAQTLKMPVNLNEPGISRKGPQVDLVGASPRASINMNGSWSYVINRPQNRIPQTGWATMRVPTAPFTDGTASVWYKATVQLQADWIAPGRKFFTELEKCGHYCAIYINDQFAGDHYGQFAPFEAEVTPWVVAGLNEIEVYAHDADSTYTRRGAVIDQSQCPGSNPNCLANSYRPAASTSTGRDWVGIVGDITISWRPAQYVSDVQVITSVRSSTLTANVSVVGAGTDTLVGASVLDGVTDVLDLSPVSVVNGIATLTAQWPTPTLWEPGQPKLYTLRTTLTDNRPTTDPTKDQRFDRFGFREVWIEGKTVFLNGQPLWLTGDYEDTLAPIREYSDRRPLAMLNHIQQQSGMTGANFHWDDAGRHFLDLADEMGILVLGAFYCTGADVEQAQVDSEAAWQSWMLDTATEWTRAERNHPSIVLWRPMDVLPFGSGKQVIVFPIIAGGVRSVDTTRPLVDGSDVDSWAQSAKSPSDPNTCDDGSAFAAKLAGETKPLLIKEIYGFGLPCAGAFFSTIYNIAYSGGGAGVIVQEMSLFNYQEFTPTWFSQSGIGNRAPVSTGLPNWLTRQWSPNGWSTEFSELYTEHTGLGLLDASPIDGEYQATSIPPGAVFLVPPVGLPVGAVAGADGTADLFTPVSGANVLVYWKGTEEVHQNVIAPPPSPF
jgi:hypothetical protein